MKPTKEPPAIESGDLVLKEIWRIKDELSAARGHDVHRLFAELPVLRSKTSPDAE
jgi:hypothetical protein